MDEPPGSDAGPGELCQDPQAHVWQVWQYGLSRFQTGGKVNSVQEACTKCFAVHILKFEILQIK